MDGRAASPRVSIDCDTAATGACNGVCVCAPIFVDSTVRIFPCVAGDIAVSLAVGIAVVAGNAVVPSIAAEPAPARAAFPAVAGTTDDGVPMTDELSVGFDTGPR